MVATVNIVIRQANSASSFGDSLPIGFSQPKASMTVTSGVGAAPVVIPNGYVPQAISDIWEVTAKGGAVYCKWGNTPAPVAAIGDTQVLDGQTRWFGVTKNGETMSIIDSP